MNYGKASIHIKLDMGEANTAKDKVQALLGRVDRASWEQTEGGVLITAERKDDDRSWTRHPTWLTTNVTAVIACSHCDWQYDPNAAALDAFDEHACTSVHEL